MKIKKIIRLIESQTGKKVILKESLGSNTQKFIKDCLEGDLSVTKGQLLIIINEFFSNFESVSEFNIFYNKVKKGQNLVLKSLSKVLAKETGIVLAKVEKTLQLIFENIDDIQEFRKIYIEVEKGLLGDYIVSKVPSSVLKGVVPSNSKLEKQASGDSK